MNAYDTVREFLRVPDLLPDRIALPQVTADAHSFAAVVPDLRSQRVSSYALSQHL